MKRLKIRLFLILTICLLMSIEVTANIIDNQPEKNRQSLDQDAYRVGEKGPSGGKVVYVDVSGMHGLEAKTEDEINFMTWNFAVVAVQESGSGWRLPTIGELLLLYEHRTLVGGFSDEDYWSSTEQDVNSAWIQGFRLGDQDRYNKHSKLKARAVRTF
jgi:hypothetical protein